MKLLLDTVTISAFRRPDRQAPNFRAWLASVDVQDAYLSAISLAEIGLGIERRRRRDPLFHAALRTWFHDTLMPEFGTRVLPFGEAAATACFDFKPPETKLTADAMIAATALAHGLRVATRNVRDFGGFGVGLVNPWD